MLSISDFKAWAFSQGYHIIPRVVNVLPFHEEGTEVTPALDAFFMVLASDLIDKNGKVLCSGIGTEVVTSDRIGIVDSLVDDSIQNLIANLEGERFINPDAPKAEPVKIKSDSKRLTREETLKILKDTLGEHSFSLERFEGRVKTLRLTFPITPEECQSIANSLKR